MWWLEIVWKWRLPAAWWSLVGLAAASGGNDGGTGPGGGIPLQGRYLLVGANDVAVPGEVSWEGCTSAQIIAGAIALGGNSTWQMEFDWRDAQNVSHVLQDYGHYRLDGDALEFTSEAYGDHFEGEPDGALVWVYYDFCTADAGEDLDLAFAH